MTPLSISPLLIVIFFLFGTLEALSSSEILLKEVVRVKGSRNHRLMGYGLISGLNGTGDKNPLTLKLARNFFKNMGLLDVTEKDMQAKNLAGVMVTAEVDNFLRTGDKFDVFVSSLGDAKSLKGGYLLPTLLKGGDGSPYAQVQGLISLGSTLNDPSAGGASAKTHETLAKVPNGGILEKDFPYDFHQVQEHLGLVLFNPDFTTADRIVKSINKHFDLPLAKSQDSAFIRVSIPGVFKDNIVHFISQLQNLKVTPLESTRVVVNERTGTVVMGAEVRISPTVLAHGDLQVKIGDGNPPENGGRLINLKGGETVESLVTTLNSIGTTPKDLVAILQALKIQGALKAELVIF